MTTDTRHWFHRHAIWILGLTAIATAIVFFASQESTDESEDEIPVTRPIEPGQD